MKSKSIMRCMLVVLMMALIAFFWSSAALAQEICSGSAHISLTTSLNPIHVGQTESWGVFIGNDCFYGGNPANEVTAKFVANASLCGTSDVKVVMAFGESGTFTFQNCTNLNPHITSCALDPSDPSGNTVLIKTDCTGIDLAAGAVAQLATINATATTLPPGNNTTAVGTSSLVPGNGPMITTDPICLTTEYAGAEGTITVRFETRPCIDVNKSVNTLKSKPSDSVTYTIELCNCGDVDLNSITVSDTKLGNLIPPFPTTLAKGTVSDSTIIPNCVTKTFNHTIPSGTTEDPYVNVVTATGTPAGSTTAESDVATASVDLFQPCINITKDCSPAQVDVGTPVSYTITLNNCSSTDTPNLNCTITDTLLPLFPKNVPNFPSGGQDVTNGTRNYQESDPDTLTNTTSVTCTIPGFPNVLNDTDSCSVSKKPSKPCIDIKKQISVNCIFFEKEEDHCGCDESKDEYCNKNGDDDKYCGCNLSKEEFCGKRECEKTHCGCDESKGKYCEKYEHHDDDYCKDENEYKEDFCKTLCVPEWFDADIEATAVVLNVRQCDDKEPCDSNYDGKCDDDGNCNDDYNCNDDGQEPCDSRTKGAMYRIIVTNCGTVDLKDVVITDPILLGQDSYTIGNLAAGDSVILTSKEIPAFQTAEQCCEPGEIVNTATATGSNSSTVTDRDSAWLICGCLTNDDCKDKNACTTDTCVNNQCIHTPNPDCCTCDSDCKDNNACTIDKCVRGQCTHTPRTCNDKKPCTIDSCDPVKGCVYKPKTAGTTCNDSNACTKNDKCNCYGQCVGTKIYGCCTCDRDCNGGSWFGNRYCDQSSHTCKKKSFWY